MNDKTSIADALLAARPQGASTWELPPWGHPLGLAIYPLLIDIDSKRTPNGSAFCISKFGIIATATHVLHKAIQHRPQGARFLGRKNLEGDFDLGMIGVSVLHNMSLASNRLQVNLWPLVEASCVPPTDLTFARAKLPVPLAFSPLPVSFAVPRLGSTVYCVGYRNTSIDDEDRSLWSGRLENGKIADWSSYYRHQFTVVEAEVTEVFLQGLSRSFVGGACFAINRLVEHGMSGGPVFNEAGYVCGIVCSSGVIRQDSSLVSLLYPGFLTPLPFGYELAGGRVPINVTRPMIELVDQNAIVTDGSEELVHFAPDGDRWRVGPLIHKDDSEHVFDDVHGFEEDKPSVPEKQRCCYRYHRSAEGTGKEGRSKTK